ncbi:MAG: recombination protein O N-terminal domain-containing protein [Flavobacteriales bacterium]|nr:recombination protein O N-terminal domain-containing protein [Flavobacteriales bacterium]
MLHTTRGIVLRCVRHSESTLVLKAFTEHLGVRSFLVRPGRKGGGSQAALQALNRVELVASETTDRDLLSIRELRVERPFLLVPVDPVRGALVLFVQEVLYRVLRGESADPELYVFVEEAVELIDTTADVRNFPLVFLVQLSGQLGFMPAMPAAGEDYFDLHEGEFTRISNGHCMGPPLSTHLATMLSSGFSSLHDLKIGATQRRELLDRLLLYFRMHVEGLGELRSPLILQQVLG